MREINPNKKRLAILFQGHKIERVCETFLAAVVELGCRPTLLRVSSAADQRIRDR